MKISKFFKHVFKIFCNLINFSSNTKLKVSGTKKKAMKSNEIKENRSDHLILRR